MRLTTYCLLFLFVACAAHGQQLVRIVRWISPVTGDYETLREDLNSDTQLQSWGYRGKVYQFSGFLNASNPNMTAVNRWVMPRCAGSILIAEHEIPAATLLSWGYKSKQFLFYAYRTRPATGDFVAVNRWINVKPQGDPCRDFTLSVATTELTDAQLRSWGYSGKLTQFWIPRPTSSTTPVTANGMLDADFSRPEIPLGVLDRPTPPAFVESQNYPGKPIPGTIQGDLYSFWAGNRNEFVVATDPAAITGNRFLRLPHLPGLSMLNLISQSFSPTTMARRQIQARFAFIAHDPIPDDVTFILNDPGEIFSNGGLSDGIPNGIVRLRLQNGQIWARTEGADSPQIRVGVFRPNVRTEITVKLLLRPNAMVEVSVTDGSSPTVNRTARTPAQSFLPIEQVGRLAWHIMPPVYQQRPAQLQEFRLLGAYIQTY